MLCNDCRTVDVDVVHTDLTVEDDGNYTCEIRGNSSNVLASKTFSIVVQGSASDNTMTKTSLLFT